jgi:sugar/nucleoside kinase (ribokinase family)
MAVGGLVPNDGVDLKTVAPELPIYALGRIGEDAEGRFAMDYMAKKGVDISHMSRSAEEKTGFTDVMSVTGGQRTFFTFAGANASFGEEDIPWEDVPCRMLHLGYFLLLDRVDGGEGLKILKKAKELGIQTSIDLVSENSDRYACVLPCLPYVDNLIVNELEAGKLAGIEPTEDNLALLAKTLLSLGVRERVIIHTPKEAVCVSAKGCVVLPSHTLPDGFIRGTTGAGDAFCSGALIGIYYGMSDEEILELARTAAAASLRSVDATGGMVSLSELRKLAETFKQ